MVACSLSALGFQFFFKIQVGHQSTSILDSKFLEHGCEFLTGYLTVIILVDLFEHDVNLLICDSAITALSIEYSVDNLLKFSCLKIARVVLVVLLEMCFDGFLELCVVHKLGII